MANTTTTNTTTNKKEAMTQAKALRFVLDNFKEDLPADVAERLQSLLDTLNKRSSAENKKASEKKKLDLVLRQEVVNFLSTQDEKVSGNTIFKNVPAFDENNFSGQKVVNILTDMVKDGLVERATVKGRVFYSLAVATN